MRQRDAPPKYPATRHTLGAMTALKKSVTKAFTDVHVALIRSTYGRVGVRIGTMNLCILTTTGRKSGVERHRPLACFPHGDALVVIASAGDSDEHPGWYRNLVANPAVRVERDGEVRPMTAPHRFGRGEDADLARRRREGEELRGLPGQDLPQHPGRHPRAHRLKFGRTSPGRAKVAAEMRDREGDPPTLTAIDQALLEQRVTGHRQ
jgi:deazaflavin-dependent oxidoreductase (nitroreductase family)